MPLCSWLGNSEVLPGSNGAPLDSGVMPEIAPWVHPILGLELFEERIENSAHPQLGFLMHKASPAGDLTHVRIGRGFMKQPEIGWQAGVVDKLRFFFRTHTAPGYGTIIK